MAGVTSVVIDGTTYLVDDINAVDFSEDQGLSEQQQEQGRSNIGAAAETALEGKADEADLDALEDTVGDLSDDVDGLTEALADKASAIVDTASGAIASFPDGAAVPAKDITIGIEPVQSGSGDPSPTNVRPISGWTGANVTRTGFNVWDEEWEFGYYDNEGVKQSLNTRIRSKNTFPCLPNTEYYTNLSSANKICFYDYNKAFIRTIFDVKNASFVTPNNAYYMAFSCGDDYGATYNHDICINISDPAKNGTYEPGHVVTYTISWQSEAGTVYGGTLDVTTGLLTRTWAEVDLGTLNYIYDSVGQRFYTTGVPTKRANNAQKADFVICSLYSVVAFDDFFSNPTDVTMSVSNAVSISFRNTAYTDAASFKAAMSGVQLVYELATPQTYQLAPTEVDMLLGENNVWADTGDSTVTYRADTKLYIQKINAPTDDDMIADAQIASGRYFIVGGNLYKSTTTIPAGDTITPGSNCILTNLADALNALNT